VRVTECLCNPLQDRFDIVHHVIIPEAQYSIALLHQKCGPSSIRFLPSSVLSTIQLYDQATFRAAEISGEATDGMLSTKFCVTQSSVAKVYPQPALGFSLSMTQSTGAISKCWVS
jgi:hypothetical protein